MENKRLYRVVNINPSNVHMMAVTVPEEYKHMTRKEVAEKHPEVINAMKAAVLDQLVKINALPGFGYMHADASTDTDEDWKYKDMHLFSAHEIKFYEEEKEIIQCAYNKISLE